jgi:hypothetical protein
MKTTYCYLLLLALTACGQSGAFIGTKIEECTVVAVDAAHATITCPDGTLAKLAVTAPAPSPSPSPYPSPSPSPSPYCPDHDDKDSH